MLNYLASCNEICFGSRSTVKHFLLSRWSDEASKKLIADASRRNRQKQIRRLVSLKIGRRSFLEGGGAASRKEYWSPHRFLQRKGYFVKSSVITNFDYRVKGLQNNLEN